jgi:predicted methyltransferase
VALVSDDTDARLQAAIASPQRSPANRARDRYRHPRETLAFFGLRADMTVVELWPGAGWYTELLAPTLAGKGRLTVTSFDPAGPPDAYNTKRALELQALLEAQRPRFGDVRVVVIAPPAKLDLGPPGSADLVLTFRNFHNWMNSRIADRVLGAAFAVLKAGGTLGVVEHRANPGQASDQAARTGYVDEAMVIGLARAAGFALVGRSEVNANARDTKDHAGGVWSLPPTLSQGEQGRDRYLAIGESDRMTLKFRKPQR